MFAGTEQTKTNLKISHKKNNGHLTKKTKKRLCYVLQKCGPVFIVSYLMDAHGFWIKQTISELFIYQIIVIK